MFEKIKHLDSFNQTITTCSNLASSKI